MARRKGFRFLEGEIKSNYFKPQGIPARNLEIIILNYDEWEAIRLVDYENKNQDFAANKMKISQSTLSRILKKAHEKIAIALVEGKIIKIEKEY